MYWRLAGSMVLSIASAHAMAASAKPHGGAGQAPAVTTAMMPGLWEITNAIETVGSTSKRTVTMRICYGPDDVAAAPRIIPPQREFGMKCDTRDVKTVDSAVTWRVACVGKESSLNGSGKMIPAAQSYSATASLNAKTGAKTSKVEQSISGKWISECK